ncbi:hypothetical protein BDP55DRAFT_718785 [Colletotrichum godetiae]|uniref:F-box domain-containing protein n=1 Tax=Colletotrichum godetiae TaxID=1209918 RepID=A0AAJ0ETV3_9PEZI|nr:uncharacterized protein BDP55DRAFT_718785 [Colletotrichum godetiae]KAK1671619.1 hypothetical protein BDP55DRAFT_718785 [Colletotrichum godetiae]
MASMSSLPPEMLGEIAACFQNDTSIGENKDRIADQNTLAILSRASKSFQSVAQPLLHRKIYLAVWDPVGVSILSLIKVLHHREDLRSRVGQVHIHFERAFSCRLKRTMDDIRNLGPFARTIGRPNLGTALEECKNSSRLYDTVLSSLLFHQLQGVSQVMITGLDGPDLKYGYEEFDQIDNAWSVLPALLISPSETPEALLQNLIFLRLGAHIGTTMDLSHFHLLACLALNLENFEGFRFESLPAEAFNAFKKLKHLTLWEAPLVDDVSSNQQGNFEIPPGLHSFDYFVRSSWFSDELNISPIKVRRALVRHSDTLFTFTFGSTWKVE